MKHARSLTRYRAGGVAVPYDQLSDSGKTLANKVKRVLMSKKKAEAPPISVQDMADSALVDVVNRSFCARRKKVVNDGRLALAELRDRLVARRSPQTDLDRAENRGFSQAAEIAASLARPGNLTEQHLLVFNMVNERARRKKLKEGSP